MYSFLHFVGCNQLQLPAAGAEPSIQACTSEGLLGTNLHSAVQCSLHVHAVTLI